MTATLLQAGLYVYVIAIVALMGAYGYVTYKRVKSNREAARRRAKFQEVNSLVDEIARKHGR